MSPRRSLWAHAAARLASDRAARIALTVLVLLALFAAWRIREDEIPRVALVTAAFFVASLIHVRVGPTSVHLLLNGLVGDFTFAARLKGSDQPLSTLFYLPPQPNVQYSAILMSKAEEMFLTGSPPYPVERTLLTTGILAAAMKSQSTGHRLATPHLAVRYPAPRESTFCQT